MSRVRTAAVVATLCVVVFLATSLFATSAFTSTELTREVTVDVTTDQAGLLALRDGHPDEGLVNETDEGTLRIDFTSGGGAGANENARFLLGDPDLPVDDHAFRIVNQGSSTATLELSYALGTNPGDESGGDKSLTFRAFHDAGADGVVDGTATLSENAGDASASLSGVAPGDVVYVVVKVDTGGLTAAADLSGTLTVSLEAP